MIGALLKFGWTSFWQRKPTGSLVFLPLLAALFVGISYAVQTFKPGTHQWSALDFYRQWWGLYLTFLIPIFSIFAGVSLLRDEIEGKTLVYVWTRPCGRVAPFVAKWFMGVAFFAVLSIIAELLLYAGTALALGSFDDLLGNAAVLSWDSIAVMICVSGYISLGLALATFGRRGHQFAIFYVFVIDSLTVLIPGELRKLSLKLITVSVSASGAAAKDNGGSNLFDLVNKKSEPMTDTEAIVAWAIIVGICWAITAWRMRNREVGTERTVTQS